MQCGQIVRTSRCARNACTVLGEQERLDVHVEQARDAAHGVVRVQRGEHEMARHRRADGDIRRLVIADLADHDDVRILPQDVPQAAGKRQADLRLSRRSGLTPASRYSTGSSMVMMRRWTALMLLKKTIKRSDFPGAGRAGHEDDAVRLRSSVLTSAVCSGVMSSRSKPKVLQARRAAQQPQRNALAVDRRDRGDAHVDLAVPGRRD